MNAEKIEEIKRKLRGGYPQGELETELRSEGYSNEEIQNLFYGLVKKQSVNDRPKTIPLWYAASIGFIILGVAILSVKYLWIYYYGYVFLVLGLIGLATKFFMNISNKK